MALVETAIVLPLLILVIMAGAGLGLALVGQLRLTAVTEAAAVGLADGTLQEDDAGDLLEALDGAMVCLWFSEGEGDQCWPDGLAFGRVQLSSRMELDLPFFGGFTLTATTIKPTA